MVLWHVSARSVALRFRKAGSLVGFWLGMLLLGPPPVLAEVVRTTLTVGEEWTAVREVRRYALRAGEQDLMLSGIPDTADLSSLVFRTRPGPVDLIRWWREDHRNTPDSPASAASVGLTPTGDLVIDGHIVRADLPPSADGVVVCRIHFPVAGLQELDIYYRMRGIQWTVDYQVLLRGDVDGGDEQMSVALTGFARFENDSNRTFEQASIRLAGGDPRLPRQPTRLPGFLLMIEGPLADLWHRQELPPRFEHMVLVPRPVTLSAHERADVVFADAQRIPATRLYVMDSEHTPLSRAGTFHPLGQFLVFRNTSAVGLGASLPPGPVSVYHGAARRTLRREGFLPQTFRDQEIRVELGVSPHVVGMRRSFGQTARRGDQYEELFELVIQNNRLSPIDVEIHERPPASLGWTVVRSTQEFEERRGRIIMRPRVAAGERRRIDLRLRMRMPEPF